MRLELLLLGQDVAERDGSGRCIEREADGGESKRHEFSPRDK
jgi:hypothetical protein